MIDGRQALGAARFVAFAALSIAALVALVHVSRARDMGHAMGQAADASPEVRAWVRGLKDKSGAGCCDTADGYPAEAEWDMAGEHYKVRIDGAWYVVPDEAVITEPNKLGYAVVWYWHDFEGKLKIRCFIPGGGV